MIKDELRSIPKGMNHGIDDFTNCLLYTSDAADE